MGRSAPIRFGRYARKDCVRDGRKRPETFDFLGFTHMRYFLPLLLSKHQEVMQVSNHYVVVRDPAAGQLPLERCQS